MSCHIGLSGVHKLRCSNVLWAFRAVRRQEGPVLWPFFGSTRGGGFSSGEGAAPGAHLVLQWCRLDSSKRLDGVPVTNVVFVGANVFSCEQSSLMKVSVSDSLMVGARLAEHLKLRVLVDGVDCAILTDKVLGKGRQLLSLRLTTQRR